jgi:hypothetical protein
LNRPTIAITIDGLIASVAAIVEPNDWFPTKPFPPAILIVAAVFDETRLGLNRPNTDYDAHPNTMHGPTCSAVAKSQINQNTDIMVPVALRFASAGTHSLTSSSTWEPRPTGLTLERIDNNRDYEPDNCKWATWKEQNNNKRPLKLENIKRHPNGRFMAKSPKD